MTRKSYYFIACNFILTGITFKRYVWQPRVYGRLQSGHVAVLARQHARSSRGHFVTQFVKFSSVTLHICMTAHQAKYLNNKTIIICCHL